VQKSERDEKRDENLNCVLLAMTACSLVMVSAPEKLGASSYNMARTVGGDQGFGQIFLIHSYKFCGETEKLNSN
jgi:hypothetical protein